MYADSVCMVCCIKLRTFISYVLLWPGVLVWTPSLSFSDCLQWCCVFKTALKFVFRFSISVFLRLSSYLNLEVFLSGDLSRLCGRFFDFNVFSLIRNVWDSFSTLMFLDLWEILTLLLLVPALAYGFWNRILCLVGCGVSCVVAFDMYFN